MCVLTMTLMKVAVTSTCNLIPVHRNRSLVKRLKLGSACQLSAAGSQDKITQTNAGIKKKWTRQQARVSCAQRPINCEAFSILFLEKSSSQSILFKYCEQLKDISTIHTRSEKNDRINPCQIHKWLKLDFEQWHFSDK